MPTSSLPPEAAASFLALLALVWLAAKLGGEVAQRLGLPSVAGELGAGLLLGALHRLLPAAPDLAASPALDLLGQLGVLVLMFAVGLESTVPQMLRLGVNATRVAFLGVAAPMAAGGLGAWLLLPAGTPLLVDVFIGACLCATSIGISARVLKDHGAAKSKEGRIIVGAAVIDDVLGLLVLTGVTGAVAAGGRGLPWSALVLELALALGFLLAALSLGRFATPHLFRLANRLRSDQVLLPVALGFAFLLAYLGTLAGLAAIVGAYAAGLILEPAHVQFLEERELRRLEDLVQPLVVVLAPLFFVLMGARVDSAELAAPRTLLLAAALAALGILGKRSAGYAAGRGLDPAVVGWGMVPRGEVGLIFVAAGSALELGGHPLLSQTAQAGLVGAILITTIAGPLGLGRHLRK